MLNKNVINVAKFSFINSLKSKVFVIFNVIIFLCILVFFNFSTVKEIFNKNDLFVGTKYNIELEDEKNIYYDKLLSLKDSYNIESIDKVDKIGEYSVDTIEKEKIVIKLEYIDEYFNISIISKEKIDAKIYDKLVEIANEIKSEIIEDKYNISNIDSKIYKEDINVNRVVLNEESVVEENYTFLTFAMTMIIYFLVIFGTNAVASQIANEKTSKSAEYIFSSIPAKDYLNGKVLGANLKTLISMLFMIFYVLISVTLNSLIVKIFNVSTNLSNQAGVELTPIAFGFDNKVIIYIALNFVFILLTSILLSYIQAGITARVKSISDMDSSQSITLTIIIIAYFLAFSITGINNIFTKILANIPIFSMFLMPVNYLNDVASIYSVLISIVVLVISILLVMQLVSKTFKKNILEIYNKNGKSKSEEKLDETKKQLKIIRKKELNSLGIVISIALISLILIQSLLGMVLALISTKISPNIYNILLSIVFVLSLLVPIAIIKIFIGSDKINYEEQKSSILPSKLFLIGFCIIFLVQSLGEIIVSKLGISSDLITNSIIYEKSFIGIMLVIIQMAVLPGIFEEILFRKVILNSCKKYGTIFAMVVSSIAFSLIHLNLSQGIVALLIGMLFSYITIKNGNIKVNIILHIINNLIATLTYVYSDSEVILNIINYVYIGISIIGGIVLLYTLVKDRKSLYIKIKTDNDTIYKTSIKDIIFNYYSIVLILFIVIMMAITY